MVLKEAHEPPKPETSKKKKPKEISAEDAYYCPMCEFVDEFWEVNGHMWGEHTAYEICCELTTMTKNYRVVQATKNARLNKKTSLS